MASENMSVAAPTVEVQISTLLDKIEAMRQEQLQAGPPRLLPMQAEMRTLEFWRSVIAECIATFLFVFIVSGAASSSVTGGSPTSTTLAAACAAGLSVAALSACFYHVSGAHINPAISIAMAFTKQISTFRAFMFVVAQCGGGIAGAAILYGISNPNHYVNLNARASHSPFHLSAWDRFASEMVLTFVVVFTYFITTDRKRKLFNRPHFPVACAYFACGLVAMPSLNPARALGPAFVLNKWTDHWVNWCGPISGGILAAFIFEHIFNSNRQKNSNTNMDEDSSSIHSDEDTYDDLDKQRSTYNTLRAIQSGTDLYRTMAAHPTSPNGVIHGYCPSLNSASLYSAPSKIDRVESLYAGTKSLYTKSPVLTRANLHRSQSVYTKSSNSQPIAPMASVNMRESPPRPGPLIPAQSLYPMRLNTISAPSPSNSSVSNQNQQNQQRLGMENVYGVRSAIMNATGVYGKQANSHQDSGYNNGTGNNPGKHSKRDDYGYTHHISSNQKGTSCNSGMKQCNSYHNGMTQGSRSEHSALQMQQNLGIPTVGPPPPYPQSQPGLQY